MDARERVRPVPRRSGPAGGTPTTRARPRRIARPNFRRGPEGMSHEACLAFWRRPAGRPGGPPRPPGRGAREQLLLPARARARARRLHALRPGAARPSRVPHGGEPAGLLRRAVRGQPARRPAARDLGAHARSDSSRTSRTTRPTACGWCTRRAASRGRRAACRPARARRAASAAASGCRSARSSRARTCAACCGRSRACRRGPPRWCAGGRPRLAGGRARGVRPGSGSPAACACWATWTTTDAAWLYASCFAFAYPSLVEGFGLPVLEAMAPGRGRRHLRPLEPARGRGRRRARGRSADEDALAAALRRLEAEPAAAREPARARSRARPAAFSWTAAARRTLALYGRRSPCRAARRRAGSGQPSRSELHRPPGQHGLLLVDHAALLVDDLLQRLHVAQAWRAVLLGHVE